MAKQVCFQMWGPQRRSLIWGHKFYYEQGKKRLLGQFDDIGRLADAETDAWMLEQNRVADPDGDYTDVYDAANDHNSEFYYLLQEMRDSTRLSLLASMFHEWEKQVRTWLVTECRHWHVGEELRAAIWKSTFAQVMDLFESMGWKIRASPFYNMLNACRLVVNVYKHGSGQSFNDLLKKHPHYVRGAFESGVFANKKFLDHTNLNVTDAQFHDFFRTILEFWEAVPEQVADVPNPPAWMKQAIESDNIKRQAAQATAAKGPSATKP